MGTILFSRHAKRRCQLYKISLVDIETSIQAYLQVEPLNDGQHDFIDINLARTYTFPIKIVFTLENTMITIITAYPLKKGLKL